MQTIHARASRIRLAIYDVDGVMTDGTLVFGAAGEESKAFNVLDGHGMKLLQESGVTLAVITSRASDAVERRMRSLGVDLLFQGADDKLAAFTALLAERGLAAEDASFMGDDIQDLPVLMRCGLAVSVPGAPARVRRHAHYVTRAGGGRGAVREAADLIMHAQGSLAPRIARYQA